VGGKSFKAIKKNLKKFKENKLGGGLGENKVAKKN